MSEERKEAFLSRWSRLKQEQPPEKAPETPMPELPPVGKLTPESDFKDFMHPRVADALRRVALKELFRAPHFNIPDPFEPFSGDWNVGEPISEKMLASLEQMKHMLRKPPEAAPVARTEIAREAQPQEQQQPDEPGRKDA
jgi:hypothetical protein